MSLCGGRGTKPPWQRNKAKRENMQREGRVLVNFGVMLKFKMTAQFFNISWVMVTLDPLYLKRMTDTTETLPSLNFVGGWN